MQHALSHRAPTLAGLLLLAVLILMVVELHTVDLKTARYTNTIGAATLMGSWRDEQFDPEHHAFYYARVLEIPTPRWTTFDAVRHELPLLDDVPATIHERTWTSPIWYAP